MTLGLVRFYQTPQKVISWSGVTNWSAVFTIVCKWDKLHDISLWWYIPLLCCGISPCQCHQNLKAARKQVKVGLSYVHIWWHTSLPCSVCKWALNLYTIEILNKSQCKGYHKHVYIVYWLPVLAIINVIHCLIYCILKNLYQSHYFEMSSLFCRQRCFKAKLNAVGTKRTCCSLETSNI